ncbi:MULTISPECIES: hypothetical protein [Psychrobacter]|mgnify:FL=1|uniref:hypothetical protein n=1 Tax=Psychrobacter TaxID=497 RepID=UPI0008A6F8A6|nr:MULTISPECIES: hypothetical protein [Psychrobacter]AOY43629.1 hypothetical protein AOT82_1250 [Psychrobacter sp. AntiMn-1]BBI66587.1 hypothetical protein PKHYL_07780 [Psychrobacter sp. KH172YL61]
MSQSNDILEPRLVAVDSYYLSVINDRIQDLSNDAESLAMALSAISTDDDTSKGVIVAVRSALLANSELATILSEQMDGLILLPELEVTDHE